MDVPSTMRHKRARNTRSRSRSRSRPRAKPGMTVAVASSRMGVGLGQACKTILKTEFFANVTSAASGVWTGYLKPGSCFDPCGDIAAIQPASYDQWSLTYGRYVVEKAKITIEIAPTAMAAAGTNYAAVVAAYPSISTTALATYQGAASQPYAKSLLFAPSDNTTSNTMVFKLDHAKILGKKGPVTAEDNGALVAADPTAGQYMVLPIFLQWATNVASSAIIRVVMYQTVHFDRRINVVDV